MAMYDVKGLLVVTNLQRVITQQVYGVFFLAAKEIDNSFRRWSSRTHTESRVNIVLTFIGLLETQLQMKAYVSLCLLDE